MLCALDIFAVNGSLHTAARTPFTLFAARDIPRPVPQIKIPTGIAIELPDNSVAAFLYARSGLGIKHGICLSNGVGVVDSDYRGEICAGLCNVSDKPYEIEPFERICQMVIAPVVPCDVEEVTELGNTERGEGGFGSTGKK